MSYEKYNELFVAIGTLAAANVAIYTLNFIKRRRENGAGNGSAGKPGAPLSYKAPTHRPAIPTNCAQGPLRPSPVAIRASAMDPPQPLSAGTARASVPMAYPLTLEGGKGGVAP